METSTAISIGIGIGAIGTYLLLRPALSGRSANPEILDSRVSELLTELPGHVLSQLDEMISAGVDVCARIFDQGIELFVQTAEDAEIPIVRAHSNGATWNEGAMRYHGPPLLEAR